LKKLAPRADDEEGSCEALDDLLRRFVIILPAAPPPSGLPDGCLNRLTLDTTAAVGTAGDSTGAERVVEEDGTIVAETEGEEATVGWMVPVISGLKGLFCDNCFSAMTVFRTF